MDANVEMSRLDSIPTATLNALLALDTETLNTLVENADTLSTLVENADALLALLDTDDETPSGGDTT